MYDPHHPEFEAPTDPDIRIWRYMDLPKLVSMIATGSLWLGRADLLDDPHEGARGAFNAAKRQDIYGEYAAITGKLERSGPLVRRCVYVNCWHMAEIESVAMWRAYTTAGHGVAVHSTFRKLVTGVTDSRQFMAGVVKYVDPSTHWVGENHMITPFVHKRRSFAYEREVRLLYPAFDSDWQNPAADLPAGLPFELDVARVIDGVRVSPDQPAWFADTVASVMDKFGLGVEVTQSDLDTDPVY